MLHQKTVMLVEQTAMHGNANAGQALRRSGSVLDMKPAENAMAAPVPVLSGILGRLQNKCTGVTNFSGGGCAIVYAATRRSNCTRVAIKHMLLRDAEATKYFNHGVEALRQFSNLPGVCPIFHRLPSGMKG
jgi:hypothetical protein